MQKHDSRQRPPIRTAALLLALALTLSCAPYADEGLLIRGALVFDGLGTPGREVSVRVRDGRIAALGDLEPEQGETVLDVTGRALAPGFIDTHSHHDNGLQETPGALAAVSQGITTIIVGQDGGSHYPLSELFNDLEGRPAAVNLASYVGHNTLRDEVMGDDFRRAATEAEVEAMRLLVAGEMEAGALGLATGLEYDPGIYSETAEVLALAKEAARHGGRYISHVRSEDRWFLEAVEELLQIGQKADIPVQISHIKLAMKSLWGKVPELLARLERARAEGIDVTADVYPYVYWQSTITVLLPERNFRDREEVSLALDEIAPADGIRFTQFDPEPSYVGKTVAEIAVLRGTDEVSTFIDLIDEALTFSRDNGKEVWDVESITGRSMLPDDVAALIAWPHTNISSDGGLNGGHPRGFGAYTRVLGRYVRADGVVSLPEAIRKMTSLAAEHVGLADRGVIRTGAWADLVLFDPETVIDRAAPGSPTEISEGIERVWVNGQLVYRDGEETGATPGVVLRRTPATGWRSGSSRLSSTGENARVGNEGHRSQLSP